MSAAEVTDPEIRGADSVRASLIAAAAELLGEVGPRSLSVRTIAERAGVNHGQIHHYFGGKRGLLEAAMRHLARHHLERTLELAGDDGMPPPLSLAEDRAYSRALCQSVMDGDLDLVLTVDADDEFSVPRHALRKLRELHPEMDARALRARFAALAAMQLGWAAFEDLLLHISEVAPGEESLFRADAKQIMQKMMARALE